jgi:hypothetical protein
MMEKHLRKWEEMDRKWKEFTELNEPRYRGEVVYISPAHRAWREAKGYDLEIVLWK